MTNIEQIKFIVYGDIYSDDSIDDSIIESFLAVQSFNATIAIVATQALRKIENDPTSYSETGGISVTMNNKGMALRNIIGQANKNKFAPVEEITRKKSNVGFVIGKLPYDDGSCK